MHPHPTVHISANAKRQNRFMTMTTAVLHRAVWHLISLELSGNWAHHKCKKKRKLHSFEELISNIFPSLLCCFCCCRLRFTNARKKKKVKIQITAISDLMCHFAFAFSCCSWGRSFFRSFIWLLFLSFCCVRGAGISHFPFSFCSFPHTVGAMCTASHTCDVYL